MENAKWQFYFWLKITIDFIWSIAVHLLPLSSDWSSEFLYDVKMGHQTDPNQKTFSFQTNVQYLRTLNFMFYKLQQYQSVQWMIIHIRYLIALAFVPSGFTKLIGERFTQLPKSAAVGQFFEAIYQAGLYYHFLGLAQIITAILLMTQRFALLGTLLFLAITSNIWVITISLPFKGTWIITSLMMFAGCILLYWDKNRIAALYSDCDMPNKKYAPKASKLWINAGIIYIIALLALCYAGPKTDVVSKGIAIVTYFVLGITFLYTNFVFWKKIK